MTKIRVLITGGAGFIGSNLCEGVVEQYRVVCADNLITGSLENISKLTNNIAFSFVKADLRDFDTCKELTKDVDIVLHQAALGSIPRSILDPLTTHHCNSTAFLNILESSRISGVARFIYASSSSVYGDHPEIPKKEEKTGRQLSPYAVTKFTDELYANVYSSLHQMKIIGLRYFNVFGKNQNPEGAYAAVIPKFIEKLMSGEAVTVNGSGSQTRDFTHVSNVVSANLCAIKTENPNAFGQVFNIACGSNNTLLQIVESIIEKLQDLGFPVNRNQIKHGPARAGEIEHSVADVTKAFKLLNYSPGKNLQDGLKETIVEMAGKKFPGKFNGI